MTEQADCQECGVSFAPSWHEQRYCWECTDRLRAELRACLGVAIANRLQRGDVKSLAEVRKLTDQQLLALRNFGVRSLRQVRARVVAETEADMLADLAERGVLPV